MILTNKQIAHLESSGLSSRILTEPGIAGEIQRLLVLYPQCPKRANALTRFVYANSDTILGALRLTDT